MKPIIERSDKIKMCDPGMCRFCVNKGDGDFLCTAPFVVKDGDPVLVVEKWQNTKMNQVCKKMGRIRRNQEGSAAG